MKLRGILISVAVLFVLYVALNYTKSVQAEPPINVKITKVSPATESNPVPSSQIVGFSCVANPLVGQIECFIASRN